MTNKKGECEIGMVGLGVMGRNLLLNMADHGFSVAGYDNDATKVASLRQEAAQHHEVHAAEDIAEFLSLLRLPRNIMLLVPAGAAVDAVIKAFLPHLDSGDLIIDAGNSYFKDTDRRLNFLKDQGIQFLGVGISGGEEGARHGPSIMPGGTHAAYLRVERVLSAVAAHVDREPCVAYMGSGSAGHFVKMVHNGIEYGIMQLIAETYDVMKHGLGLNNDQLSKIYHDWNNNELSSYLLEITSDIFTKRDDKGSGFLIDKILPVAEQKGTGMWTSQSALELQVPTPCIDIAVAIRNMSTFTKQREQASKLYPSSQMDSNVDRNRAVIQLRHALFAGMIAVYAQGMALLSVASDYYHYDLDLEVVARIWRGGCIIRANFLENIRAAFQTKKTLPNILLDARIADTLQEQQEYLRQVIQQAIQLSIPVPGLMNALGYLNTYRSIELPANLIQAQRDYFGSHTYERIDMPGTFHTQWEKNL